MFGLRDGSAEYTLFVSAIGEDPQAKTMTNVATLCSKRRPNAVVTGAEGMAASSV
jgi:hypothetical protein